MFKFVSTYSWGRIWNKNYGHLTIHVIVFAFITVCRFLHFYEMLTCFHCSPAPLLKDVELVGEDGVNPYNSIYRQCCHILRHLFHDCRLVHADFSEFNLLYVLSTLLVLIPARALIRVLKSIGVCFDSLSLHLSDSNAIRQVPERNGVCDRRVAVGRARPPARARLPARRLRSHHQWASLQSFGFGSRKLY